MLDIEIETRLKGCPAKGMVLEDRIISFSISFTDVFSSCMLVFFFGVNNIFWIYFARLKLFYCKQRTFLKLLTENFSFCDN